MEGGFGAALRDGRRASVLFSARHDEETKWGPSETETKEIENE